MIGYNLDAEKRGKAMSLLFTLYTNTGREVVYNNIIT